MIRKLIEILLDILSFIMNTVFGICMAYTVVGILLGMSIFPTTVEEIVLFILFVVAWSVPCVLYNYFRYKKYKKERSDEMLYAIITFWIPLFGPAVALLIGFVWFGKKRIEEWKNKAHGVGLFLVAAICTVLPYVIHVAIAKIF